MAYDRSLLAPAEEVWLHALEVAEPAADDPAIYVFLTAGGIDEVRPATDVAVSNEAITLLWNTAPVVTYARGDVSFCSRQTVSPFMS